MKTLMTTAAAAIIAGTAAFADGHGMKNIVETAESTGQFNTLIAAAQAAGLVEVLTGDDKITVFAPTDAAFAALPEGTVDSLLMEENRDQLVSILTYHVVPGEVTSDMLTDDSTAVTVQGDPITIDLDNGVAINDAMVTTADVMASNGVIHIIDSVLMPAAE